MGFGIWPKVAIWPKSVAVTVDRHPLDYPTGYNSATTGPGVWEGGTCPKLAVDMDTLHSMEVTAVVEQAAATGDGGFRLYNNTAAAAFTPVSVTIPQNTTVLLQDQVFTPVAGWAGTDEVRVQTVAGQATKACKVNRGGVVRQVRK